MDASTSYNKIVCLNALAHIRVLENSNHDVEETHYEHESAEEINLAPPLLVIVFPGCRISYPQKELTCEKV
jgi:hypothetical protein